MLVGTSVDCRSALPPQLGDGQKACRQFDFYVRFVCYSESNCGGAVVSNNAQFRRIIEIPHLRLFINLSVCETSGKSAMEYRGFIVKAFERENGVWRATVRRSKGHPLKAKDFKKIYHFVTVRDAPTAVDALRMALDAIDAGSFSRNTARSTEKFARVRGSLRRT